MYAFGYLRPSSLRQAVNLFAKTEDAAPIAGGQSLLPMMKLRLASPANLIDLRDVTELRGIERKGRSLVIGAMARHTEVENSAVVREAIPALADLVSVVGDPMVRNRGTIGGSVANNDPSADYPAALLALGATIVTSQRKIAADDFFQGIFTTALEPGELVTRVVFPVPSKAGYEKFRHPASRFALAGVFVARRGGGVRVAVTGAGSNGVFRWSEAEEALRARFGAKSLDGLKAPLDMMNSDIHASADYRAHLVEVMTKRAVLKATRG